MVQHDPRSRDLELSQQVSWKRCVVSVMSYALMLSDVPRAGFGFHDLSHYRRIEPDQLIFFGPYAYQVTKQLHKNATRTTTDTDGRSAPSSPFWPYKYDSTSVAMRAVAQHLAVPEWQTACVTYTETCDERVGIPHSVVFGMIDSLIDAVKTHDDTHQPNGQVGRLTLRSKYAWFDRLHDYVFPSFFSRPKLRTIQAIHYDVPQRNVDGLGSLCRPTTHLRRPHSCGDSWTNFGRLCASSSSYCRQVNSIHSHVPARLQKLLEAFPLDHTMDFMLLEGVDDLTRPSLTSDGYKDIDVVVLARIRKCTSSVNGSATTPTQCETILVDDFRYEVSPQVTNVQDWFLIIASLRAVGQFYVWMRLLFLLVGCYATLANKPWMKECSYGGQAIATLRAMLSLPSQVVVYGSLFPVSCYLVAHLMDAAIVYKLVAAQFSTLMGVMALELSTIVQVCAVSMRSLWLLVFACHLVHRAASHRVWSPIHGVAGVPEFSLSFVASLTIFAQLRRPSFRDTRILSVHELVPSATRYFLNNMHSTTAPGVVYKFLFGTPIDYKCLVMAVCVLMCVMLLLQSIHWRVPRWFPYKSMLFGRTIVPYSAEFLWPINTLVVGWNTKFLAKSVPVQTVQTRGVQPLHLIACQSTSPQSPISFVASQQSIATLHQSVNRSHETKTLIFLMNLTAMTDPLTFVRLRIFRGQLIGMYTAKSSSSHNQQWTRSRVTRNSRLLPLALTVASSDIPINWSELELRCVVNTSELDWCDLLQCG